MKKLFSRKKAETHPEQDNTPREVGGINLKRVNLLAMLVAVAVVLLCGYVAYLQYASLISSRQEDSRKAEAARIAAQLSGRLMALGDEVERLARADEELLTAITLNDSDYLRQREAQVARDYPSAMRVRYVLPDENQPDTSLTPPLSYACLDLAHQTMGGKSGTLFEVHLFGGEVEHVDLVRPVVNGETAVASLLLTLDVEQLKGWIDRLNPSGGYIELHQSVEGDLMKLFGRGNAGLSRQGESYQADIAGSRWKLLYWSPSSIGEAEARAVGFMATFAIGAGALVVFFIFFGLFISGLVRADMKRMVNFIVDSALGKRFHSYPVKLSEAKQVLQGKEVDLSVLSSYTSTKDSIQDKAEHFVPDITFNGDAGIAVEEVEHDSPRGSDSGNAG